MAVPAHLRCDNFLAHTSDDPDDGVNPNSRIKFRTFLGTAPFSYLPQLPGPHALGKFLHIAPQRTLDAWCWGKLPRNALDERN
jgi:hypothetical protein